MGSTWVMSSDLKINTCSPAADRRNQCDGASVGEFMIQRGVALINRDRQSILESIQRWVIAYEVLHGLSSCRAIWELESKPILTDKFPRLRKQQHRALHEQWYARIQGQLRKRSDVPAGTDSR